MSEWCEHMSSKKVLVFMSPPLFLCSLSRFPSIPSTLAPPVCRAFGWLGCRWLGIAESCTSSACGSASVAFAHQLSSCLCAVAVS